MTRVLLAVGAVTFAASFLLPPSGALVLAVCIILTGAVSVFAWAGVR